MKGSDVAKGIVKALSDEITWQYIHLEYADSGRTGKFYRICAPENGGTKVLTQWGARPSPTFGPAFGDRGQIAYVTKGKARELLDQKVNKKGYRIVAQGSFTAPAEAARHVLIEEMRESIMRGATHQPSQWHMYSAL